MKKRSRHLLPASETRGNFVRGFVSAGLLAGFQGGGKKRRSAADGRRILRLALQGGAALAAAGATLDALRRDSPIGALASVATGAAALIAIEKLLHDETTEE